MRNDLTERKFGTLVVLGVGARGRRGLYWMVRCRCGVEKAVRGDKLVAGLTRSCGAAECKAVARVIATIDRINDDLLLDEISSSLKTRF